MVSRSERPTTPPSFDVEEYAKDSDARIASTRPTVAPPPGSSVDDEVVENRQSATRLVMRSPDGTEADEAWACARFGAPVVVMALDELRRLPLDHRAGFLLSLMDGSMDLDTLVEVSAIARGDVLGLVRHLFEVGVVVFR